MSVQLPLARVRAIMKSSSGSEQISQEATLMIAKATELFIQYLAKQSYEKSNKKKIDYKEVSEIIQSEARLDFLQELVPKKITIKEFKDILAKKKDSDSDGDSVIEVSSDSSDNEESEENN